MLVARFKTKEREELAATAISPEVSEIDVLMEEIVLKIEEFTKLIAEGGNKKDTAERDRIQGEEIRQKLWKPILKQ